MTAARQFLDTTPVLIPYALSLLSISRVPSTSFARCFHLHAGDKFVGCRQVVFHACRLLSGNQLLSCLDHLKDKQVTETVDGDTVVFDDFQDGPSHERKIYIKFGKCAVEIEDDGLDLPVMDLQINSVP